MQVGRLYRSRIYERLTRWAATAILAAILVLGVMSLWFGPLLGSGHSCIFIRSGGIHILWADEDRRRFRDPVFVSGWQLLRYSPRAASLLASLQPAYVRANWLLSAGPIGTNRQPGMAQIAMLRVPLWLVGVIPLSVATPLWLRQWRRLRLPAGCCPCGYNLTGNVSGRCPECGRLVPAAEPNESVPKPQHRE